MFGVEYIENPQPQPPPTLVERIVGIVRGLRHVIAQRGAANGATPATQSIVYLMLSAIALRFEALVARFEAGTLPGQRMGPPAPRPAPAARVAPVARAARRDAGARRPRELPSGRGWLCGYGRHEAAAWGGAMARLVQEDPRMAALVAVCPEAARLARRVIWMTGQWAPPGLARASRKRPPRERKPLVPKARVPHPVYHEWRREWGSANFPRPGYETPEKRRRRRRA